MECFGTIVVASGGGLSPTQVIQTVRAIDGITKTASATQIRIGRPNFVINRNTMIPNTKNTKYAKIIVYTPCILFELVNLSRGVRIHPLQVLPMFGNFGL